MPLETNDAEVVQRTHNTSRSPQAANACSCSNSNVLSVRDST